MGVLPHVWGITPMRLEKTPRSRKVDNFYKLTLAFELATLMRLALPTYSVPSFLYNFPWRRWLKGLVRIIIFFQTDTKKKLPQFLETKGWAFDPPWVFCLTLPYVKTCILAFDAELISGGRAIFENQWERALLFSPGQITAQCHSERLPCCRFRKLWSFER